MFWTISDNIQNRRSSLQAQTPSHMENRMASFNKVLLTPYTSPQSESQQKSPPPPVLIDQEPECKVEEIIDSRLA